MLLAGRLSYRWITVFCRGVPLAAAVLLCACAKPYVQSAPGTAGAPRLTQSYAVMEDGYRLPLSRWESAGNPQAVLLALHGLNDYRRAFDNLGRYLARRGISVVAYDQRGFGAAPLPGRWHGARRLGDDVPVLLGLLRRRHPDAGILKPLLKNGRHHRAQAKCTHQAFVFIIAGNDQRKIAFKIL